jgi:phytoene/squalene synthetase
MMAVMEFDTRRRERLISQHELIEYARLLATAVTDALHHFIGSSCAAPDCDERYLAATGAHITHMLRDLVDDIDSGYINIPRELLRTHRLDLQDLENETLRDWVKVRARLARTCFEGGKAYLAQVESLRCRIAGWAYIARFEIVLDMIERDGFNLRTDYSASKNLTSRLRMLWSVASQAFNPRQDETIPPALPA